LITQKIILWSGYDESRLPNRIICKYPAIRHKPYRNSFCIDLKRKVLTELARQLKQNNRIKLRIEL
jgi:hypothetical protein